MQQSKRKPRKTIEGIWLSLLIFVIISIFYIWLDLSRNVFIFNSNSKYLTILSSLKLDCSHPDSTLLLLQISSVPSSLNWLIIMSIEFAIQMTLKFFMHLFLIKRIDKVDKIKKCLQGKDMLINLIGGKWQV